MDRRRAWLPQAQLGAPWVVLFGTPVYQPWKLFEWWYAYEAYAPHIFDRAGMLAGASGFMGCAAAVAGSLWRARQNRLVTTYGSSRWANKREIEGAGLFRAAGVFLGRLGGQYLRHDGPEHVVAFAPTRSGKGVGLVIPTLLSWTGSAVVHDIKGENWQLTAGWRSKFSHCLLFNPTDPRSARYSSSVRVVRLEARLAPPQSLARVGVLAPQSERFRVLHHRRQHRQRPVRRSRACGREIVEPVAHVLRTDGIDAPVAEGGQYVPVHAVRVRSPRRGLPAFRAVGEERRRERPHRRRLSHRSASNCQWQPKIAHF